MDGATVFTVALVGFFAVFLIAAISWFGIRAHKNPWLGEGLEKALNAVQNETDQVKLEKIVKNAQLFPVRVAAAEKLADKSIAQEVFAYIAINFENKDDCMAAVKELTEQSRLADVTIGSTNSDVRKAAVEKIYDQGVLADIAERSKDKTVRVQAKIKLSKQGVLVKNLVVKEKDAPCSVCYGSGWLLDGRDDSHHQCAMCKGTGVLRKSYYDEAE